jgi:hypothetical protein
MARYVGVSRKIVEWELHQDGNTMNTLMHLLALSADKKQTIDGVALNVGQVAITISELANMVGITYKQMRTCISRLQGCNLLRIDTNNHRTIFTVLQSDLYVLVKKSNDTEPDVKLTEYDAEPHVQEDVRANQKASRRANQRANKRANQKSSETVETIEEIAPEIFYEGKQKGKPEGKPKGKPQGKPKSDEYTIEFLDFYDQYPRHVAKDTAYKAWKSLNPSPELQQIMLMDIAAKLRTGEWELKRPKYIPHMATYLNGRRWQDENTMLCGATDGNVYSNPFVALLRQQEEQNGSTADIEDTGNNMGTLPKLW